MCAACPVELAALLLFSTSRANPKAARPIAGTGKSKFT
jgi:hypothetical protein